MVIPGRHHRMLGAETGKLGVRGLQRIGGAQGFQPGIGIPAIIAVIIVADHQEQLRIGRGNLRPHMLRGGLVVAAAEGDAGERGRRRQRGGRPGLGHHQSLAQLGIIGREQLVRREADADRHVACLAMIIGHERRGRETGSGERGGSEQRQAHGEAP